MEVYSTQCSIGISVFVGGLGACLLCALNHDSVMQWPHNDGQACGQATDGYPPQAYFPPTQLAGHFVRQDKFQKLSVDNLTGGIGG